MSTKKISLRTQILLAVKLLLKQDFVGIIKINIYNQLNFISLNSIFPILDYVRGHNLVDVANSTQDY